MRTFIYMQMFTYTHVHTICMYIKHIFQEDYMYLHTHVKSFWKLYAINRRQGNPRENSSERIVAGLNA